MRDTWPISALIVIWYGWTAGRVKARRGIEVEKNPLREIEERCLREFQTPDDYTD